MEQHRVPTDDRARGDSLVGHPESTGQQPLMTLTSLGLLIIQVKVIDEGTVAQDLPRGNNNPYTVTTLSADCYS
jgi:hypothetical protein